VEGGTLRGREMFRQISSRIRLPRNSRDVLHAAGRRVEDFFALKNTMASAGFEPAKDQHATSRPPKPLIYIYIYIYIYIAASVVYR
jgi:hypothetical protein